MTDPLQALRSGSARALRLGGGLIWAAAAVHFAALPLLRRTVAGRLTPEAFEFVWPPFAFSFLLDGILLIPLGFTALYCAGGVLRGERWATVLGLATASVVALLPLVIGLVMGIGYFGAMPFLVAALVILAAGVVMLVPLVRLARRAG
ncbi:MAG: hypothetical protein ACHQ2E_01215 [Gemmatimonadales bacterium]